MYRSKRTYVVVLGLATGLLVVATGHVVLIFLLIVLLTFILIFLLVLL